MLRVNQLIGFGARRVGGGAQAARVITWQHNDQVNAAGSSGGTTYSWTSVPFGTAAGDRKIIVGIVETSVVGGNREGSAVTVAGISGSFIGREKGSSAVTLEFWIASVPTGTSGTIDVVWNGSCTRGGVAVWSATGLASSTAVDFDSMGGTAFTTTNLGLTLTTTAGGVAVAYAYSNNTTDIAWTNASERFDVVVASPRRHSGADASTPGSSLTITGAPAQDDANSGVIMASFF